MASPIRLERMTSWSGTTRAIQLRHGDVKCAGMGSNHRCRGHSFNGLLHYRSATDALG
jgi:hypothetical protein